MRFAVAWFRALINHEARPPQGSYIEAWVANEVARAPQARMRSNPSNDLRNPHEQIAGS